MDAGGWVKPGYYPEFPVERILKPKFSFRINVDEDIDDLMSQIHSAGMVIEPIVCRPAPGRPGYVEVGPGERRLRAAKRLRMKTLPVIVKEMDDATFDRVRALENLARKDLSDMEIARILRHMLDNHPYEYPSQEVLANALGKSRRWVERHLRMLDLEKVHFKNATTWSQWTEILSKITEGQARQILSAPPEKRVEIAEWIIEKYEETGEIPSAREIRRFVQRLMEPKQPETAVEEPEEDEIITHLTEEGRDQMAGRVEAEPSTATPIPLEVKVESTGSRVGGAVEADARLAGDEEPSTRGGEPVEESRSVKACPFCGSPIGEDVYRGIVERLARLKGLFDHDLIV